MNNSIKNEQINIWFSTDLSICSYLSMNFDLIRLVRIEGNRYKFVFERTAALEQAIEAYYNNTVKVSPFDYFNSIRSLKSRIYSRN